LIVLPLGKFHYSSYDALEQIFFQLSIGFCIILFGDSIILLKQAGLRSSLWIHKLLQGQRYGHQFCDNSFAFLSVCIRYFCLSDGDCQPVYKKDHGKSD
jgi:hypothetical protein